MCMMWMWVCTWVWRATSERELKRENKQKGGECKRKGNVFVWSKKSSAIWGLPFHHLHASFTLPFHFIKERTEIERESRKRREERGEITNFCQLNSLLHKCMKNCDIQHKARKRKRKSVCPMLCMRVCMRERKRERKWGSERPKEITKVHFWEVWWLVVCTHSPNHSYVPHFLPTQKSIWNSIKIS